MIRVQRSWVQGVRAATSAADLHEYLQAALNLEHATIPLYLNAYLSLQRGTNNKVGSTIRSVVVEEMLHFVIVANVLNAVGGHPVIDSPEIMPTFPGPLPMGIDDDLVLHLAPMSMAQCKDFMDLEEPEHLRSFPGRAAGGGEPEFETIGTFYDAITDKIRDLGDDAFLNPTQPQVTAEGWFLSTDLFPVTDVRSAVAALELVVRQGEGTRASPIDAEGDVAHYYRFSEIKHGHRLVAGPGVPEGFSFTGDPVPFDANQVWPFATDPRAERYPEETAARRMVDQFNRSYTKLLEALHETFNGQPEKLDSAMGLMFELRLEAQKMVATPDPSDDSLCVTPTWQYLDPSA